MKRIGKNHYTKSTAMGSGGVWGAWTSARFSAHTWLCDLHLELRKKDPHGIYFCARSNVDGYDNRGTLLSFIEVSYERKITILEKRYT